MLGYLPIMGKETESLADYVGRVRKENRWSLNDVARRSVHGGSKVSNAYVSKIENGIIQRPSVVKLRALARGLGVSEEDLFARARSIEQPEGFRESKFWAVFDAYG